MTLGSAQGDHSDQTSATDVARPGDISALARDLVDKVGIDGARGYCRSLGWRGVLDQVELLQAQHLQSD